jgi:hypothetical protein
MYDEMEVCTSMKRGALHSPCFSFLATLLASVLGSHSYLDLQLTTVISWLACLPSFAGWKESIVIA